MDNVIKKIKKARVIAAVRKDADIEAAVRSEVTTIFLLHADIFNIKSLVDRSVENGKSVFIHIDFLEGIGKDEKAIEYIARVIHPNGIISTKSGHIKYAKEQGIFTIQRFFLVDSLSYETTIKTIKNVQPGMIEIMPAVMPGVIRRICRDVTLPVIAGGLIDTKEDIMEVLKSGAIGVSTAKKELWVL